MKRQILSLLYKVTDLGYSDFVSQRELDLKKEELEINMAEVEVRRAEQQQQQMLIMLLHILYIFDL